MSLAIELSEAVNPKAAAKKEAARLEKQLAALEADVERMALSGDDRGIEAAIAKLDALMSRMHSVQAVSEELAEALVEGGAWVAGEFPADVVIDAWMTACRDNSGLPHEFEDTDGSRYTWDTGRGMKHADCGTARRHSDGSATGAVFKATVKSASGKVFMCVPVSGYRIEPDGTVTRAPAFLVAAAANEKQARRLLARSRRIAA